MHASDAGPAPELAPLREGVFGSGAPALPSRARRRAVIAGAMVVVGLLGFVIGGAVMSPSEQDAFSELAWPQTDEDVIEVYADTDLVPSSTRYLGTVDGFEIYLGLSAESGGACIAVVGQTSETGWSSGCSDSPSPRQAFGVMNMRGLQVVAGESEQLLSDGPVEEIPLSENVTVYRHIASTDG